MAVELKTINISGMPEVLTLAEEVRASKEPCLLRRDSEDVAILMPVRPARKRGSRREKTTEDYEAFLSSAGSWKDIVDVDKLIADIYESRRPSSRPAVVL